MTGAATGTVAWTYDTRFRVTREEVNGAGGVDIYFDDDSLPTGIGDLVLKREAATGRVSSLEVRGVATKVGYTAFGELASLCGTEGSSSLLAVAVPVREPRPSEPEPVRREPLPRSQPKTRRRSRPERRPQPAAPQVHSGLVARQEQHPAHDHDRQTGA